MKDTYRAIFLCVAIVLASLLSGDQAAALEKDRGLTVYCVAWEFAQSKWPRTSRSVISEWV